MAGCGAILPAADRGKDELLLDDVLRIEESPTRLPAQFADELYAAGETRMGGTMFALKFGDGSVHYFATGNAIDFLRYPEGLGPKDVVGVIPHETGRPTNGGAPYAWCLYGEPGKDWPKPGPYYYR